MEVEIAHMKGQQLAKPIFERMRIDLAAKPLNVPLPDVGE